MEKQVFEFVNYDVPLTIGGHEFTMNCSADTGDYLKEVAGKLRTLANEVGSKEKTNADIVAYGEEVIDHLLGAGAAALLLSGRASKVSDTMDICMFLTGVAAKFSEERKKLQGDQARHGAASKK